MNQNTSGGTNSASRPTDNNNKSSARINNNNNNNNKASLSFRAEIRLPSTDYQLHAWKVRDGAAVRMGETIALAICKSDLTNNPTTIAVDNHHRHHDDGEVSKKTTTTTLVSTTTTTLSTAPPTSTTTIKRATKRKRPTIASSTASSSPTASTTATPTSTTVSTSDTTSTTTVSTNTATSAKETASKSSVPEKTYPILSPADGIVQIQNTINASDGIAAHSDSFIIGYVTACAHPTVVDGLCAVCGAPFVPKTEEEEEEDTTTANTGTSMNPNNDGSATTKMSRVTVGGGVTMAISQQEGQRMAEQDVNRLHKARKLALILDLDHTLVHATNDMRALPFAQQRDDVRTLLLPVLVENEQQQQSSSSSSQQQPSSRWIWMQHFIKLRPHLVDFFQMVSPCYEIGVYTAGTREYAEQITILLSRQLVGARHDQVDLDHLRHAVYKMQMELLKQQQQQQQQQQQHDNNDNNDSKDNHEPLPTKIQAEQQRDKQDNNEDEDDKTRTIPDASSPKKKTKKRVTFGEAPPAAKSDRATPHDLIMLQRELAEAERLESLAMEMRQRLFGGRIVSRSDVKDLGQNVKSLKRIFPCGGSMAAVVDDREDVWANASDVTWAQRPGEPPDNLLLVKPYHWDRFMGFADVNNPAGVDLTERFANGSKDGKSGNDENNGEDEKDKQLLWTADILKRLHETYYSFFQQQQQDQDDVVHDDNEEKMQYRPSTTSSVPEILRSMRHQVLQGKKIVLSGLIPLHKQNQQHELSKPRPPIVRYVENLGAVLLPQIVPTVTHVVGIKDGTDKIIAARKNIKGCKIVKLSWLMECVWSLTKRKEEPHFLGPRPSSTAGDMDVTSIKQPFTDSTRNNSSDSSSNDEDDEDGDEDDLAAEFENDIMSET